MEIPLHRSLDPYFEQHHLGSQVSLAVRGQGDTSSLLESKNDKFGTHSVRALIVLL